MIYNFSNAFVAEQGPRLEEQWNQRDEILKRRAAFVLDEETFGTALERSTCAELETIGRILDMPRRVKTLTKDDAVQAIIKTVQERLYFDKKFHDPVTKEAWGMKIIYDVSVSLGHKCPSRWALWDRGSDDGSRLVCYLLDRVKFMQVHLVPPTCGRKTVNGKPIDTLTPRVWRRLSTQPRARQDRAQTTLFSEQLKALNAHY